MWVGSLCDVSSHFSGGQSPRVGRPRSPRVAGRPNPPTWLPGVFLLPVPVPGPVFPPRERAVVTVVATFPLGIFREQLFPCLLFGLLSPNS